MTYQDSLAARLTAIVANKLRAPVTFLRWDRLPTGADLPVFGVPAESIPLAHSLGLTVEAV